jgi:hypothetical protein
VYIRDSWKLTFGAIGRLYAGIRNTRSTIISIMGPMIGIHNNSMGRSVACQREENWEKGWRRILETVVLGFDIIWGS